MRTTFSLFGLTVWFSVARFGIAESLTRCGTEPSVSILTLAAGIADEEARVSSDKVQDSIEIDTYFHVVAATDSHEAQELYITVRFLGVLSPWGES